MKTCKGCGHEKDYFYYYKSKGNIDGLTGKCKDCIKADVRDNKSDYDKTEKGVIRVIYKTQKGNSVKRGHPVPSYSKSELKDWLYGNGFKDRYDLWVKSGFKKDVKPSVDRIDDFKPYTIGNIRLVTWLDNRNKQYQDIESGAGTGGLRCKKLIKMDSAGVTICEYISYNSAARDIGHSLEYSIKNSTKCKFGFFWAYK